MRTVPRRSIADNEAAHYHQYDAEPEPYRPPGPRPSVQNEACSKKQWSNEKISKPRLSATLRLVCPLINLSVVRVKKKSGSASCARRGVMLGSNNYQRLS
jgi:hypothetical protein